MMKIPDDLRRAVEHKLLSDNDRGGAPLGWLAAAVEGKASAIAKYGRPAWDAAYADAETAWQTSNAIAGE